MSLFVCQNPKCNVIENTNCVTRNIGTNDYSPNMHLMDMQGHGDAKYVGKVMDYQRKLEDEILMLCSECNT